MRILLPMLAFCCLLPAALGAQSPAFALDEKKRDFMTIRVEGANRDWQIRPQQITNAGGRVYQGASVGDFALGIERWERTGLHRRYNTAGWKAAAAKHLGAAAAEGDRFYFIAINPTQPRAEGTLTAVNVDERQYWSPAKSVKVVGYPQTWVDVFENYVAQFSGDERRQAVLDWEEHHRDTINSDGENGFSQEERNEFARFYQAQFVYVRNQNPKLANIYDELANFHRERNNLDAELSTYLDALRAGVESPDRERFALEVGSIFVRRLGAHSEAVRYLGMARNHTGARYLLAECRLAAGEYDLARAELVELVNLLASMPADGSVVLEETVEIESGRANLLLAELEFKLSNLNAASAALSRIADNNPYRDAARVQLCAMLLQRDGATAFTRIREELRALSFWQTALGLTGLQAGTVYPLDPLMARAMVLFAEADNQFRDARARESTDRKMSAEVVRFLTAAKAVDPLSAEPYYTEGRLHQRLGNFPLAYQAYQQGLAISPRHVALNYSMAELHLKAGLISVAQEHLGRCLKFAPDFYAAHAMLGEIALLEIERARESLAIRMASGEAVDYAGELVPPMKEAAAFFTSSLAANPDQPHTQLALATLHLRLAEVVPLTITRRGDADAVRRAHLTKARDMARQLMDTLDDMAKAEPIRNPTERQLASVPSMACYNVYAYALYALGDHNAALQAFQLHIVNARNARYIPDGTARAEYGKSSHFSYAEYWVNRIQENQRQYFQVDEFREDSKENYYGTWKIPQRLKPDLGFPSSTRIRGGRLNVGVDQKETGIISRIETEQPHRSLSVFEAEIVSAAVRDVDWGIHMTKALKGSVREAAEPAPVAGVMLGMDADGRLYWEAWKYERDAGKPQPELPVESGYLDPLELGGWKPDANRGVVMSLRRQISKDLSSVDYIAVIDGMEVTLPIKLAELTKPDFNQGRNAVMCGFFTRGFIGAKANIEVERVKFIFDDGLSGQK